jgi:hypothetical protein
VIKEAVIAIKEATEYGISPAEKEVFFLTRTNKHRMLVRKAINMIVKHNPEWKAFDEMALIKRGAFHDQSKYEVPERPGYVELTWNKAHGIDDDTPEIDAAWKHHQEHNSHHPEFFGKTIKVAKTDPTDPDCSIMSSVEMADASDMSNLDIAEMVADWVAMGWELSNSARDWYNKENNERWMFTPTQNKLIDELLKVFEQEANNEVT